MAHRDNVVLDVDERPAPWQGLAYLYNICFLCLVPLF